MAVRMLSKSYSGLERRPGCHPERSEGSSSTLIWDQAQARHPYCHPERSEGSSSTNAQTLRCAQDDKTPACHPERSEGSGSTKDPSCLENLFVCHPERSEGSGSTDGEILRCIQSLP